MKIATLKRRFINEMYDGDYGAYLKARKQDYCKVQFEWSCWMDSLCRNSEITLKQYENVTF